MFRKIAYIFIGLSLFVNTRVVSAVDTSKVTNISIAVGSAFSMEFYTDQNVVYRDVVPFSNVDPGKTIAYPDGRAEKDGKADVGIVCRSNSGVECYLKIHAIKNPPLTVDKLQYYISQPYNRNTGGQSDGTLTQDRKSKRLNYTHNY